MLQVLVGFFLEAKNTPEVVCDMLAHSGGTVSSKSRTRIRKSLFVKSVTRLKKLGRSKLLAMGYDNLDFKLPVGVATSLNLSEFVSITTGIFFPLIHKVVPDDLKYNHLLWERSLHNPHRLADAPPDPSLMDPDEFVKVVTESSAAVDKAKAWHIREIIVSRAFPQYRAQLGEVESSLTIDPIKTFHAPAHAVRAKVSTNDGNIEATTSLLEQAAVAPEFLQEYVILINGDLGVLERQESCRASRSIETSPVDGWRFPVLVPGLFHGLMAATDAIWRTHLENKALHREDTSTWAKFSKFYPKATAKLNSNPPYRMMHNGIMWTSEACFLDAWVAVSGSSSLDEFVASKPSWERIYALSERIASEMVASNTLKTEMQDNRTYHKDSPFENQLLYNRDALLYRILSHAMKHGKVGLVEDVLWQWVVLWKGCGKHKYAAHYKKFLAQLRHFPERLSRAIRLNWLCNPTGKPDGFRAIDWLIEWNNLFIKVRIFNHRARRKRTHQF